MSVASMVSPTTPGSADLRRFDRPLSLESAPNSASLAVGDHESVSRRESVDSRINQGFGEMRLGSSPYTSHNQSTASIQNSLQQHRNPRPGLDNLSVHRISNGYQPSAERNPDGHPKTVRTAPAITGPATSHIARAAEPTKGQAWAFPEEEIQRMPSAGGQSLVDSRRSSVADSIASSQFTTESRLPPGQRRLDEGLGSTDYQRLSSASADFPTTHHHALQHRQLGDLQDEPGNSQAGPQPYSRTPELRVSHKLAERKRRTEMKELFEQLRDLMPQERGSKASKWEILTKGKPPIPWLGRLGLPNPFPAISEHQRQHESIRSISQHCASFQTEAEALRRELHGLRMENQQLRTDLASVATNPATSHPNPQSLADPYARATPRPELPPLRALGGSLSNGPESMTGVQYDAPRSTEYRTPAERY